MPRRLGILRSLLYYPFYPFWHAFFEDLGFSIVVSPPLSKEDFDQRHRHFVGDICLPIESAFYHVEAIKDRVDLLFLPRGNRIHEDTYVCPACAGFPYVVRHRVPALPDLLTINLTPFLPPDRSDLRRLRELGHSPAQVKSAYRKAQARYRAFVSSLSGQPHLDRAIDRFVAAGPAAATPPAAPAQGTGAHILLLGMPYVLADPFVNQSILSTLEGFGCRVSTPMMRAPDLAHREVMIEGYAIYWNFAGMSVAVLEELLRAKKVDAVVYCSSFACGVDSLITPIIQSACQRCYDIPLCILTMDEHSEGSYLTVRMEAFLDCVNSRLAQAEPILNPATQDASHDG
jgi:predicted nucleotide-binding protein (sugar kinase/HSP70/actin superfamily)